MAQRIKSSVRAVISSNRRSLWIVFLISLAHIAAIAQFTRGFLLTRPVLREQADEICLTDAPFKKAVILVVDALRYDFVETPEGAPELPYLRHFPVNEISEDPARSFSLKFLADPPTTTLQRLKGLTTGSLPAFIDAGANFAGFKIEEDNWVSQAARHLGPVSFVGDDTWEALFAHEFSENHPFPSLNVRDLDTVDNGVKQLLPSMLRNESNKVVIGHMLGVDHVGHRYGPSHPSMTKKLDETFAFVRELAEMIDDQTVLVVMGDHGMDQTGNHGGDSREELEAALWVYAKRASFISGANRSVRQIDLVPTISGLLGLPIPFNSLGFPIRQAFGSKNQWKTLTAKTKLQLQKYSEVVGLVSARDAAIEASLKEPEKFQQILLEVFRDAWVQFDTTAMYSGAGLLLASVIASLLLYNSVAGGSLERISQFGKYGALGGFIYGVLAHFVEIRKDPLQGSISILFKTSCFSLASCVLPALLYQQFSKPTRWTVSAIALFGFEVAAGFSNSFIIWESRVLHFLLATAIVFLGIAGARHKSPIVLYLGAYYTAVLLVVLRVSSCWVVCREETAAQCETTFFEAGSSLVPTWTLFAIGALGLGLPYFLQRFWAIGGNYVGVAQLLLNMTPLAFVFIVGYWSLDNAEARGWIAHDAFGLQTGKLLLGRLSLAIGTLGGLTIWWRNNVPIEIVLKENRPEKIEGYNNIHGAHVLLVVVCLFWSFVVANKPPAILALAGLLYASLSVLDFVDVTEAKYTMLVPVLYDMMAHAFFYFTGHQATISSIQWDMAFIAAKSVKYPWSPLTIILNTFGPFILCGMVSVFSALWRRPPFKNASQPVAYVLRSALGLSAISGAHALSSMLAAFLLRRHLMSWKIFAPKYMFGALALLAVDAACILGVFFSGHTIKEVTETFGHR